MVFKNLSQNIRLTPFLIISFFSTPAFSASPAAFSEWFALGSGCRAKFDIPGDVTQEISPVPSQHPGYQRIRFHLPKLHLNGSHQLKTGRDFGRECAIRLKVAPEATHKISDVIAETSLDIEKPKGVQLTVATELKIGQSIIDARQEILEAAASSTGRRKPITLGGKPNEALYKPLQCGEPKIVGFDYTWIVSTTKKKPKNLAVNLAGNSAGNSGANPSENRVLDIFIKIEPCSHVSNALPSHHP